MAVLQRRRRAWQLRHPRMGAAPAPNDHDVAITQTELIRLLRLSPTLTTVVSHDPSLLSNPEYVAHNNPQLATFLTAHPEVARNPEFYLFSHLKHEDGQPDEALQRAVWPDVYRSQGQPTSFERIWSDLVPLLAFACGLTGIFLAGPDVCRESPLEPHLQAAERSARKADRQIHHQPGTGRLYGDRSRQEVS